MLLVVLIFLNYFHYFKYVCFSESAFLFFFCAWEEKTGGAALGGAALSGSPEVAVTGPRPRAAASPPALRFWGAEGGPATCAAAKTSSLGSHGAETKQKKLRFGAGGGARREVLPGSRVWVFFFAAGIYQGRCCAVPELPPTPKMLPAPQMWCPGCWPAP